MFSYRYRRALRCLSWRGNRRRQVGRIRRRPSRTPATHYWITRRDTKKRAGPHFPFPGSVRIPGEKGVKPPHMPVFKRGSGGAEEGRGREGKGEGEREILRQRGNRVDSGPAQIYLWLPGHPQVYPGIPRNTRKIDRQGGHGETGLRAGKGAVPPRPVPARRAGKPPNPAQSRAGAVSSPFLRIRTGARPTFVPVHCPSASGTGTSGGTESKPPRKRWFAQALKRPTQASPKGESMRRITLTGRR